MIEELYVLNDFDRNQSSFELCKSKLPTEVIKLS